jgi:hypothetical protein
MEPGMYALVRNPAADFRLRCALNPNWIWGDVAGVPAHLPLFLLARRDMQDVARTLSCHQDIAADGCFSVCMLTDFRVALAAGPSRYRELLMECGLLGQMLYLEAEAVGMAGTGIGCFFDDAVHRLLGCSGHAWQVLYHFTVGSPVRDLRLQTLPPYAHLHPAHDR